MKKTALILVHPSLENESVINKTLISKTKEVENLRVHNLYENYKDRKIDIKKEQELLLENDVIIFQFPLYWFSSPSLLKEWFDVVLTPDFAFNDKYLLEGKKFAVITTAAGSEETYKESGITVKDYLKPFQGTASYIKMHYKEPFIVHNTYVLNETNLDEISKNYLQYIKDLSK